MEHMSNYNTCHMDWLCLITVTGANVSCLFAVSVCCVYCHICHFTCRIMRTIGVWNELKKPW